MKYLLTGFADEIAQDLTIQLESLKKLDMHYVEMRGVDGNNLIYHSMEKIREIKKRLDEAGIRISALGSPLGKIGIEDPFEEHFEDFRHAVEIAHMVETENIRMFSFYMPEGQKAGENQRKEELRRYRGQVFERIGQMQEYAARNDIVLLHENEKGIYGERASECLDLMENFGGEHFKAIFDFANFVQAGEDTREAYQLLKDHIAYIHVKDALAESGKVVPAGQGDGNVVEILGKLFADGFAGFLSLEPHLFDFVGFAGLEKEKTNIKAGERKKLSGYETFTLAHDALLSVLEQIEKGS